MPKEFIAYTTKKAKEFNLKHEIIELDFINDPEFISNNSKRCYNCRKLMYENIQKLPEFKDYDYFIEGTNLTDLLEDRPGVLILDKYNMISPLIECKITKEDVFNILDYFNLSYSSNTTCLSTRVKTNEYVSPEKLSLIDNAENIIREYVKQRNVRVRFDNYQATISVDSPEELMNSKLSQINERLLKLGFKKVLFDITGYTKTKFEYEIEGNNYFYQLPYKINIDKTIEKINKSKGLELKKQENNFKYNNIIIEDNGKITMPINDNFYNKINEILPYIKREI